MRKLTSLLVAGTTTHVKGACFEYHPVYVTSNCHLFPYTFFQAKLTR